MYKIEYTEGHSLKEKDISFEEVVITVLDWLNKSKQLKTVFQIPCNKGMSFHQSCLWDIVSEECPCTTDMFKGSLVLEAGKNAISFNKETNAVLRDRTRSGGNYEIYFNDYHFGLVMMAK